MNQETIGNILLVLAAPAANVSVIFYHLSTRRKNDDGEVVRWWESPWGRHLMVFMVAFALVLDLGVVKLVFGDSWWFFGLRAFSFLLLVGALYQRSYLMVLAYLEGPPAHVRAQPEGENDEDLRP